MIVNLIRYVEISYKGQGALLLKTDVPGPALSELVTLALANQTTRTTVRIQLPTQSKAVNLQVRFTAEASSVLLPFTISVYVKALGQSVTAWRWIPLPIPRPGEDWIELPIPVPETPEQWTELQIPVPPTPEDWTELPVIADDGSEYKWFNLPGGEDAST